MEYVPGTWCWTELSTTNAESAKEFYQKLFNWSHRPDPYPNTESYTTLLKDHLEVGALYELDNRYNPELPPHWTNYVAVENVQEVMERVEAAGGNVVFGPTEVPNVGTMVACMDDQGAPFSIWQPMTYRDTNVGLEYAGTVGWRELYTPDPNMAADFYGSVFGWTVEDWSTDDNYYAIFFMDDSQVCGMRMLTPTMMENNVPTHWQTCFTVEDANSMTEKATSLGATVVNAPYEVRDIGTMATLKDKEGALFSIANWAPNDDNEN